MPTEVMECFQVSGIRVANLVEAMRAGWPIRL
jgi:hypothetical protein